MRFGHFPFYPGFGGPFGFHLLGAGLTTLFWLGLLGLLVWAVLRFARGRPRGLAGAPWQGYAASPSGGPTATEILRQRYARGEIDAETYQQMLERLQASVPPAPPAPQTPYAPYVPEAPEPDDPSRRPML
jgi:putative membrane protein